MDEIDKLIYVQWQDKILCEFLDKCPCRIHCFLYPDAEYFQRRMQHKYELFIKRLEISTDKEGLLQIGANEWKRIFGYDLIQDEFCECLGQIEFDVTNGIIKPMNQKSKYINCYDGHRVTVGNKESNIRKTFVFGACNVFGLFCDDSRTICSYLQNELNKHEIESNVINCGVWGSENILSALFSEEITNEDEVVIILTNFHGNKREIEYRAYVHDLSKALDGIDDLEECLINNYAHFNRKINYAIATQIFEDVCFLKKGNSQHGQLIRMIPQNYFVGWNIYSYYHKDMSKYNVDMKGDNSVGCIVMNCNPVTLGHQALVKYASQKVDFLIVFIVEEDVSEFKFFDRYIYAQKAFSLFENVKVLPSGKYIISLFTFPDYFEKNQIKEKYDIEYDLRIFSEVIAPMFNIKKRFIGNEPFSVVTRAYNDAMKRVLPEYGIDVVEMNRVDKEGIVVSASLVRSFIAKGKIMEAVRYIPEEIKEEFIMQMNCDDIFS